MDNGYKFDKIMFHKRSFVDFSTGVMGFDAHPVAARGVIDDDDGIGSYGVDFTTYDVDGMSTARKPMEDPDEEDSGSDEENVLLAHLGRPETGRTTTSAAERGAIDGDDEHDRFGSCDVDFTTYGLDGASTGKPKEDLDEDGFGSENDILVHSSTETAPTKEAESNLKPTPGEEGTNELSCAGDGRKIQIAMTKKYKYGQMMEAAKELIALSASKQCSREVMAHFLHMKRAIQQDLPNGTVREQGESLLREFALRQGGSNRFEPVASSDLMCQEPTAAASSGPGRKSAKRLKGGHEISSVCPKSSKPRQSSCTFCGVPKCRINKCMKLRSIYGRVRAGCIGMV
mmetsp:Transcript_16718/g.24787  ORF Transcript_16718/g.24787 Transcript_16718/m.24787 type:complete len:343 (-) Transcript_16718:119-1147(-)